MKSRIKRAGLPAEIEKFVLSAVERHTVKIADYYASVGVEVQALFEESALVIIDYDKAIANDFVHLTKKWSISFTAKRAKMRDDFCAFILTNGRPEKVHTYNLLKRTGYTGKAFIVIDDEDNTREQYLDRFGDKVLIFSKEDIASRFDEADNFGDRRSIFYVRNACFELAKVVGCRYFIQFDDDYKEFQFRVDRNLDRTCRLIDNLDDVLSAMLDYYISIPTTTIAMPQDGDFLGDSGNAARLKRKAMNSFICSIEKSFAFVGGINEGVSTYATLWRRGELFMTIGAVQLLQQQTQKSCGGMTELYLASGTHVKSFYSVMFSPTCVKISLMGSTHKRIHHQVRWNNAAVKILRQEHKKSAPEKSGGTKWSLTPKLNRSRLAG